MNEPKPSATAAAASGGRRRRRTAWLWVGAILTTAALAAGSLGVVSAWSNFRDTETGNSTQSYSRPAGRLDLALESGGVHLTGTGDQRVETQHDLHWSGSKPVVTENWEGDALRVDTECPEGFLQWFNLQCSVGYTARLPYDAAADIDVTTADVEVRALRGELRLTSTTGDITVDDVSGPLSARLTTGDITGSNLDSPDVTTQLKTGATKLGFTQAPDHVTAASTTGPIIIEVPDTGEPYRVNVKTTTGDQQVDIARDPDAARVIDVRTTKGDVSVRYR